MKLRSRGLAAVGLLLMGLAAALGAVLVHDSAGVAPARLAAAEPGERVEVRGDPEPFAPGFPPSAWRPVLPLLGNHTYTVASGGVVALLTGEALAPDGTAVAEGTVAWVGPHPDGSQRLLVVVQVAAWREPLLFR